MLAAVDLGMSTAWMGAFDDREVSGIFAAGSLRPVAILPIGYSAEEPEATSRRPHEDVFYSVG